MPSSPIPAAHRITRRLLHVILLALLFGSTAAAQTADEHAAHHPQPQAGAGSGAAPAMQSGMPTAPAPTAVSKGMQANAGMSSATSPAMGMGMMKDDMGMEGAPRRELYPSLMQAPSMTPEVRADLENAARDRIAAGRALILAGTDALRTADRKHDVEQLQASAAQLREGVAKLDSGAAAMEALSQGHPPRAIAMDWFKSNMSLLPAQDMVAPHGLVGLSWFHYFLMALLLAFVAASLWMRARKMARARTLAARLAPDPQRAAPRPVTGLGPDTAAAGTSAVLTVPVAGTDTTASSSRPNSWTGLLRIDKIFAEAPNVRTLRLVDPTSDDLAFRYLPGQFVTFTVHPNNQPVKRSYTISSSPTQRGFIEVTVKREPRGTVSGFLHDTHEGDTLQVTGPSGGFTFLGDTANSVVLISGGVGITPMMSVVRYLTDRSWRGDIFFVYACRGEQDVIFREELEYLCRRHTNVHLAITASEPTSDAWPYRHGFVTRELLQDFVPYITTRHVRLCGPKPMMDAVKRLLAEMEVPESQVVTEVFVGKERPVPGPLPENVPAAPTGAPAVPAIAGTGVAVARFVRSAQTAMLPRGKTVLEAAEDIGVNIDYSCRAGKCGVCKVKLLAGAVSMEVDDALDDQDRKNGIILACQARADADISVDA